MSKLTKNLPIEIPKNVSIDGRGYVRKNGHPDHKKILIGKVVDPSNWKEDRRMYPNGRYFSYFNKEREDAESFTLLNSLNIGVYAVVKKLAEESGVIKILSKIFNKADTNLILDLALYILADENAEFQHFLDTDISGYQCSPITATTVQFQPPAHSSSQQTARAFCRSLIFEPTTRAAITSAQP